MYILKIYLRIYRPTHCIFMGLKAVMAVPDSQLFSGEICVLKGPMAPLALVGVGTPSEIIN